MMEELTQVLLALALVTALVGWWPGSRRRVSAAGVACSLLLLAVVATIAFVSERAAPSSDAGRAVVAGLSLLLAVAGGGPLTTQVFRLIDGPTPDDRSMDHAGSVLRGGAWIGALERGAVVATLVAGWPEGVAVVLGIKGLGRYPELRSGDNSGAAERFIIGTFTSVLWAVACAGVVRLLT